MKAKVLVGVSVGCLMGCFRAPQPWRKTAPLRRPIKRSMNSNVPSKLVPSTFLKPFRGERGCPWYGPSARPGRHFATEPYVGLRYKRAFVRFFGLIFGHSWGIGKGPGWHLVWHLCETRKALDERHVWKTFADYPRGGAHANGVVLSTRRISAF